MLGGFLVILHICNQKHNSSGVHILLHPSLKVLPLISHLEDKHNAEYHAAY